MADPGTLASHSAHFVVFGAPAVGLGVLITVQELRGRRRGVPTSRPPDHATGVTPPGAFWQWVGATGLASSAVVHAAVIPEHFAESFLYGLFLTALMITQAVFSVVLLRRPGQKLLQRVGLGCLGVVGLWLLSRTSGLPIGPHPWHPESFGRLDDFASLSEGITALACAQLLRARRLRPVALRSDRDAIGCPPRTEPVTPLGMILAAVRWLPRGRPLPDYIWTRRHRGIVRFALLQAVAVGAFGFLRGYAVVLCLGDVALVGLPALLARSRYPGRRIRTIAATVSLMLASVTIVDLAGGVTEAHFHFFVMVGVVALYQDWTAFGVCFLIVVADHAVIGTLRPSDVYGTRSEQRDPVLWAFIHGAFILAVAFTHLLAWRNNEQQYLSDPLTYLPNRAAFNERMDKLTADLSEPVTVLFIDLDHFKNINDSFGHHVGDQALQAAAGRISACSRSGDTLARLGGDEFAIVLAGSPEVGQALATRIIAALQTPVVVEGIPVFVRASIGVADSEQAASRSGEQLLRCADLAMYMAKSSGKNSVVVYNSELDRAAREQADLAASLRPALIGGQFRLNYQPVVNGADGTIIGAEALLRWTHPTLGEITPGNFITLAEKTGDINAIGLWVLQTAAAQMAEWNGSSPDTPDLTLAVNVSPVQLDQPDFAESVLSSLAVTGLRPELLILEVTEGLRLHDWDASCQRLSHLRTAGIKVAIDDFGTGYSSLSYLNDFPADIVKIDQSFVRDLQPMGGSIFLVNAIMEVARSLQLDVIAEGVETPEQQSVLLRLGCLHSQGYLHARPLSVEAFGALLGRPSHRTMLVDTHHGRL